MIWSALTYAGTGWMCKIDGNMDKTLYKEILQDEQDRTINFAAEELNLKGATRWYSSMTMILSIRRIWYKNEMFPEMFVIS
jgi:hypothetical protein